MSDARVPLTSVIPTRRLADIKVDEDLATRFNNVAPAASDKFSAIGDAFYRAFLEEVSTDVKGRVRQDRPLVGLLVRLAGPLGDLSTTRLDEPIFSPKIGWADTLTPPRGDPLTRAYWEAFAWLIGVVRGRWQFDPVTKGPADDRALIPHWIVYSLLELGRGYVEYEPDRGASPARARAYLYTDHADDEWHFGRPRYQTERVFLDAPLWLRRSTESRQQFLMRIIEDVVDSALKQVVPAAESMDQYVEEIDLPYERGPYRTDLKRARECG